jgi:hypothetical protein
MDNKDSVEASQRCIDSARKRNMSVTRFPAITPRTEGFEDMVENTGLNIDAFATGYSRPENALACFLSHMSLWQYAVENRCNTMILEHDAVFKDTVRNIPFDRCVTFGKPSYGTYNTPETLGTQLLVHKRYFGGAHAYIVSPLGAEMLLDKVRTNSEPTDIYLNRDNFPFLEEHYPWLVEVEDTFSTVQTHEGCHAKHGIENKVGKYRLLEA